MNAQIFAKKVWVTTPTTGSTCVPPFPKRYKRRLKKAHMSQEWVGRGAPGIGGRGRDTPAVACAKTHPIGNAYRGRNGGKNCCRGNSHVSEEWVCWPEEGVDVCSDIWGFCFGPNWKLRGNSSQDKKRTWKQCYQLYHLNVFHILIIFLKNEFYTIGFHIWTIDYISW